MKKGLLFTLDAIFAVLIATSMITASYFYLSKTDIPTYNFQDLYRDSMDILTVLEKDSTFANAVETSSTNGIDNFITTLPSNVCVNVTIFDNNSNSLLSTVKAGCSDSIERVTTTRAFVSDGDVYYAYIKYWYD